MHLVARPVNYPNICSCWHLTQQHRVSYNICHIADICQLTHLIKVCLGQSYMLALGLLAFKKWVEIRHHPG